MQHDLQVVFVCGCLTFADMETSITVRVDQKTKDKLEKAAKKDGRTLSNYVRRLLEKSTSTS